MSRRGQILQRKPRLTFKVLSIIIADSAAATLPTPGMMSSMDNSPSTSSPNLNAVLTTKEESAHSRC